MMTKRSPGYSFPPDGGFFIGKLMKTVFSMHELLANKKGASVERCGMLENYETLLYSKARENASPAGERFSYGYCVGKVE